MNATWGPGAPCPPGRGACQPGPLSAVVAAARQLFGPPPGGTAGSRTLQHPVVTGVAKGVILVAVLVPVTVRRYVRPG
jgi:hypothetical protein